METNKRERVLHYDVVVLDSGTHGLDGRSARLEVHYGPIAVHAVLVPERGRPLTWRVGHTARGGDVLVVSGPNTGWRFQVVTAYGTQREPLEKKVGTLRENAIALRQKWLEADLRRLRRGFRDTENLSADEQREAVRGQIEVLKRELRTLAALPADATDADVRRAMGLEAD